MKKKYKRKKNKPVKIGSRENEHKENFFKALNFMNYLFYFIGCLIVIIIGYWNPYFFKIIFGAAYIPSLAMALWGTFMSRDALEYKLNHSKL